MEGRQIALTGGIATGKSTVAKMFSELGARVIDADEVARRVVQPGEACWRKLKDSLGESYFLEDGQLNRQKLRNKIIEDVACRSLVNSILHPAILQTMDLQWREWQEKDPHCIIIFDIPLLFEIGLASGFDTVILVYVPETVQIERLMARDGLTREEAEKTLSFQQSIETKRQLSRLLIDNSRDLSHTRRQVESVWALLKDEFGQPSTAS